MMNKPLAETCFDPRVAIAALDEPRYPEEPGDDEVTRALARIADQLGWASADGGALGRVVPRGARVLVKPNFVLHRNEGPGGMLPLVTHQSVVRVAVEAALRAGASEVSVGDAPIQSCDFDDLMRGTGLGEWARALASREPRFKGIHDFRRTTCVLTHGVRVAEENLLSEDQYVLFDLGGNSLLEEVTDERHAFRVTWYDPRLMARTHYRGRHQYLVARSVLEADVLINLPKLKTHKKAGVTCALKNLIGINGNKEYLPHHRLGGAGAGGDCYPGASHVKRALEYVADRQNLTDSYAAGHFWYGLTFMLTRVLRLNGDRLGYEGSWSGNDTIWRTCLDLNRILLYGRTDGTMADAPQRRVVHIVDAIIAGQGEGPLAPQPLPLGLMLGGQNAAAVDWVGAQLLGYDPCKISLTRKAFNGFRWPLTDFASTVVTLAGDRGTGYADELLGLGTRAAAINYPIGWRDAAARPTVAPPFQAAPVDALSHEG